VDDEESFTHVSGHPYRSEIRQLLDMTKPKVSHHESLLPLSVILDVFGRLWCPCMASTGTLRSMRAWRKAVV
jgi:hypothetical protein